MPSDVAVAVARGTVTSVSLFDQMPTVILHPRHPEPSQPVAFDQPLPGEKFFDRNLITRASLIKTDDAVADRCHDLGLAPGDPAFGIGRR